MFPSRLPAHPRPVRCSVGSAVVSAPVSVRHRRPSQRNGFPAWALRLAAASLLALALGACSTVRFGYGQAERVLSWYLESYVTLDRRQTELLGQALAAYKSWHCSTQLAGYAAWVRQAGNEVEAGLVPARIEARADNVLHFARILADEAVPHLVPVVTTLTDRQLDELRANLETSNRKYRETWVDRSEARIRAERAARMQRRLEWWLGPLRPAQRERVERWAQSLQLTGAEALESRRRWQRALLASLGHRDDPARLQRELRAVLVEPERYWTEGLKRKLEANRDSTYALLADVGAGLDAGQRTKVRARVDATAGDFDRLGCGPVREPGRQAASGERAFGTASPALAAGS